MHAHQYISYNHIVYVQCSTVMLCMCLLGSFLRFLHLSWFLKVGFFLGASDCWIGDPSGTVEVACLCATWPRLRHYVFFNFRFLRDFAILDVARGL